MSPRKASDLLASRASHRTLAAKVVLSARRSTDGEAPHVMPCLQTAYGGLTEWETEVLVLITRVLSSAEIMERLVGAEPMIRAWVSEGAVKPGSRAQAAVFAYEARLMRPNGQ